MAGLFLILFVWGFVDAQDVKIFHGALFSQIEGAVPFHSSIPLVFTIPTLFESYNEATGAQTRNATCPFAHKQVCHAYSSLQALERNIIKLQSSSFFVEPQRDPHRKKRAIESIGRFFNWCCSLLTESDLTAYTHTEEDLTTHVNNLQDFVHAEHKDLLEDTSQMQHMTQSMQRMMGAIRGALQGFQSNLQRSGMENEAMNLFTIVQEQLRAAIYVYTNTVAVKLMEIKHRCALSQLSEHIALPEQLRRQLLKMEEKLKRKGFVFAVPVDQIEKLRNLKLTTCLITRREITATIQIPIRQEGEIQVFHVRPVPLFWRGHTCSLIQEERIIIRHNGVLRTLRPQEEEGCSARSRPLCFLPRLHKFMDEGQECLHKLLNGSTHDELQAGCRMRCEKSDNKTVVTTIREDTFLMHNVQEDTEIRCGNQSTRIPHEMPGTLEVYVPCECEVKRKDKTLIPILYPCDVRSHNQSNIFQVIPITWSLLPTLELKINETKVMPSYINISKILNVNWGLEDIHFQTHNIVSGDLFTKVTMPDFYGLGDFKQSTILLIFAGWQLCLTVAIFTLLIKHCILQKAMKLVTPPRDYPKM